MLIISDQDVSEVMNDIDLYDHSITEVFGEEAVENYIESHYDMCEPSEILDDFDDEDKALVIICRLNERRQKQITREEAKILGYSLDELSYNGCDVVDEDTVEVVESKDQMVLFPELEIGLPPYKVTIKINKESEVK